MFILSIAFTVTRKVCVQIKFCTYAENYRKTLEITEWSFMKPHIRQRNSDI